MTAEISQRSRALTVWFTGLSGAGKSTLAAAVHAALLRDGSGRVELLDADQVRPKLSRELGFGPEAREENVRRLAYVAGLLTGHGVVTLVACMSPYRASRAEARAVLQPFLEVFVDAPLEVCQRRDPSGVYRRFKTGEFQQVSGLDQPYEPPLAPEVHCRTAEETLEQCSARVLAAVRQAKT